MAASLLADNGSRAVVCASAGKLGQALAWSGAVAWCWAKGRQWRNRIRPVVTGVEFV